MTQLQGLLGGEAMCRLAEVPRSGYYRHLREARADAPSTLISPPSEPVLPE
jgi:hypothetical protein